ncbi:hypothetical protein [Nitrincola lacisaponensis]|uniref:hypothetical protein n=1 Tax=Nitrincola lacisaponensis TaxID=267850 RepID=UPI0005616F13|nr:hypothetical protein [Nitrincola lacisaponensis]
MKENSPSQPSNSSGPEFTGVENPFIGRPLPSNSDQFLNINQQLKNPGINLSILQQDSQFLIAAPIVGGYVVVFGGVLFLFLAGFLLGVIYGKIGAAKKFVRESLPKESLLGWAHYQTSKTLSFLLIISGLFLLLIGASGVIEIEIQGAKIVTSLPGIAVIYFGYRTWSKLRQADA